MRVDRVSSVGHQTSSVVTALPMGFSNAAEIASRQMELWVFPLIAWGLCHFALLFVPNSLRRRLGRSLAVSAWIAFAAYAVATLVIIPLPNATVLEAWQALYNVLTTPAWRPNGMSARAWAGGYTYCAWPAVVTTQALIVARNLVDVLLKRRA